jgi:hypothetical protein
MERVPVLLSRCTQIADLTPVGNFRHLNRKLNPFRLVLNRGRYVRLRRRTVDHDKIEVIDKIEVT